MSHPDEIAVLRARREVEHIRQLFAVAAQIVQNDAQCSQQTYLAVRALLLLSREQTISGGIALALIRNLPERDPLGEPEVNAGIDLITEALEKYHGRTR